MDKKVFAFLRSRGQNVDSLLEKEIKTMDCDCLPGCPFFHDRMETKPVLAELYKKNYCRGDFNSCARHMIKEALGKEEVPSNLFPNEHDKARALLNP